MNIQTTSSFFICNRQTTQQIMIQVIIACLPGIITLCYFFGTGTLIQLALACVTALIIEGIALKLRHQLLMTKLSDSSALLTAILLAISLPPLSPWWMIVLATTFAIIIAKHLYGGLGHNPFNPSMVGYVVLLISFPEKMNDWLPPYNLLLHSTSFFDDISLIFTGNTIDSMSMQQLCNTIDGITQATPLNRLKKTNLQTNVSFVNGYSLDLSTDLGWISANISFLIGGVYLIWRKIISWHIPFSFLATILTASLIYQWLTPLVYVSPLLHLFSGATMLGAFFIATDPVTTATTNKGRLIFGILTGLLVWLIRTCGSYPDGVAFAVLLANTCMPLIDQYTTQSRTPPDHPYGRT